MTLFEYLAVAFSLVFSFSAMRLLAGLPHAIQPGRRYWIHVAVVSLLLLATVALFWNFWSFRHVTWTFPRFLLVLSNPGLIYYNACILIPENPSAVESWRTYYYSVHRRFFVVLTCWVLTSITIGTVVLQEPWVHPTRLVQAALLGFGVAGVVSASERVHAIIVLLLLLFFVLVMLTIGLRPGGFATP
jgi:hypothetical protein